MKQLLTLVTLGFMLLSIAPAGVGARSGSVPEAKQQAPTAVLTNRVNRFLDQVNKSGYEEQQGEIQVYDFNQAYCIGRMWSALGPNPTYFTSNLPTVPGQAPGEAGLRLRQDEALVMIGITPPPMAYFSINVHMIRGVLSPPENPLLWIPVGDQINNQVIRTTGRSVFNALFAVVVAANQRTQSEVHRMLKQTDLGAVINDQVIPPALFRLGLDAESDEFGIVLRTAVVPESSQQAFAQYKQNPPIQIFRVRPKGATEINPVYAPDPLPVPPLRVPGTGDTSELDLNPTLQLLRQRIIDTYPGYTAHDVRVDPAFERAYPGLQTNAIYEPPEHDGVAGASNDAVYFASPYLTVPDGSFLVAYGPEHRATGKATYASVSVYADPVAWVGPLASAQSPKLQGSASNYIGDQPNTDKFYAWTFSRTDAITGPYVTMLPSTATDFCGQFGTSTPVDMQTLRLLFRAYVDPATKTHPAEPELLFDRLLLFTPE